jgi:hypothetical protein
LGYEVIRSRRPAAGAASLILFPTAAEEQSQLLNDWLDQGGILVLADDRGKFARGLGIDLRSRRLSDEPGDEPAKGPTGVSQLRGGMIVTEWPGHAGEVWAEAGGTPFVTRYRRAKGEIWLLNRPEILTNRLVGRADNGVLLCRLAEAILARRSGKLAFDEYFHGLREHPQIGELLLRPLLVWVTLQGLLLVGLLLWHFVPRFGTLQTGTAGKRRGQEEFLDALASLLERKRDYAAAYQTAREDLMHEMERDLGIPASTTGDRLLQEATRRRPIQPDVLRRLLSPDALPPGAGPATFLKALNELESVRDDFFRRGSHR